MKILLDTCVWGGAIAKLEAAGIDAEWTGHWKEDPGDHKILDYAYKNGRILVTLDKDFGEMAILREIPHCGIMRLVSIPARLQAGYCLAVIMKYGSELQKGAIVTVKPGRVRIRNPE
jgi:predicted nuclease of predicted toxin-antitoxin system